MIELYYPGKEFVTVSVTGKRCDLMCRHCNARFLKHMESATTPNELYRAALNAEKEGCTGMLVSGGSDPGGKVPLSGFLNTIKNIKNNTNLLLNLHTGFIGEDDIEAMKGIGVNVVSFDVAGSPQSVRNVYGLDLDQDYFHTILHALKVASLNVVPHVTAGLDAGGESGEERALDIIAEHRPGMVIVNSLIPAPGQSFGEHRLLPVLETASQVLPGSTRIGIGCMRPRDIGIPVEKLSELRVSTIASPPRDLADRLTESGIEFTIKPGCCAFASL